MFLFIVTPHFTNLNHPKLGITPTRDKLLLLFSSIYAQYTPRQFMNIPYKLTSITSIYTNLIIACATTSHNIVSIIGEFC